MLCMGSWGGGGGFKSCARASKLGICLSLNLNISIRDDPYLKDPLQERIEIEKESEITGYSDTF